MLVILCINAGTIYVVRKLEKQALTDDEAIGLYFDIDDSNATDAKIEPHNNAKHSTVDCPTELDDDCSVSSIESDLVRLTSELHADASDILSESTDDLRSINENADHYEFIPSSIYNHPVHYTHEGISAERAWNQSHISPSYRADLYDPAHIEQQWILKNRPAHDRL